MLQKLKPKVSIIIPTYNRPELLKRAINSVLSQTYPNIEIIVIDDASEMDINRFKKDFPNILFLQNSENRGPCHSRNRGIKEASSDYINFLDDDDILFPEKIERQVARFLESDDPNLGMVTAYALDERSGTEYVRKNMAKGDLYRDMLYRFEVSGIETTLFKKSVFDKIGGFDENLQSSQEYDLLIRAAEFFTFDYVDEVLSKEFRSTGQISVNFDKKIQGANYLFKKHNHRYIERGKWFWFKMQIKHLGLLCRYYSGKWFGENFYRLLLFERKK